MSLFRVKICGITSLDSLRAVVESGVDAIGVNFYSGSTRYLDAASAKEIVAAVPSGVAKVGVFVNASIDDMRRAIDSLGLDFIQLHGDETPETIASLGGVAVIRAIRYGVEGVDPAVRFLGECRSRGALPSALLIDADAQDSFGGSGRTVDWVRFADQRDRLAGIPLILAGGLNPWNVAQAIAIVRPDAVDVAGGVESSPGVKDAEKTAAFNAAAQMALAALQGTPPPGSPQATAQAGRGLPPQSAG